jgi:hypothetical protein
MAQVILSFDTEDYTTRRSQLAAKRLADIMTDEGVRGAFNVVGEVARFLASTGMDDVVRSLGRHEINFHSNQHSRHPTIPEYCDTESWDAGLAHFLQEEEQGLRAVYETFGIRGCCAAVPPGNSIAAQAIYGYGRLGIPIYSGSLFKSTQGRGIWYCGALNLENNAYLDDIAVESGFQGFLNRVDEWSGWKRLILCCHPNMAEYSVFWDALNMKGGNHVRWGEWIEPPRRRASESAGFYETFRALVRLLRDSTAFELVTYEDVWRDIHPSAARSLTPAEARAMVLRASSTFPDLHVCTQLSYADALFAAAHLLAGRTGGFEPRNYRGPDEQPVFAATGTTVSADDVVRAARRLVSESVVPHQVMLGRHAVGPGDFLRAAGLVMGGATRVVLEAGPQVPKTGGFFGMDRFRLRGTWMHAPTFQDRFVTTRLRLQSWTIRLEPMPDRPGPRDV